MVALLQALVRSHPGPRNGPAMPSTHSCDSRAFSSSQSAKRGPVRSSVSRAVDARTRMALVLRRGSRAGGTQQCADS